MHTINPEVINLTLLAAVGIWTLVRFLGSRGERMSTRVLFAFAPHAAFGFAMVMASCSAKTEASAPEACDMISEFSIYSYELRRMANAKEMCGRLDNWQDFTICVNQPPIAILDRMNTCEDVRRINGTLNAWLNELIPPAKAACMENSDCGSYIVNDHGVY